MAPLPKGRDALSKRAGGTFVAKAGSKLCLRPGPKAGTANLPRGRDWGIRSSVTASGSPYPPAPVCELGHPPLGKGGIAKSKFARWGLALCKRDFERLFYSKIDVFTHAVKIVIDLVIGNTENSQASILYALCSDSVSK